MINQRFGDRIGLTITITGNNDGVSEWLQDVLTKHGVTFEATDWVEKDNKKLVTFRNIPTSQLPNLGRAVAEIEKERSRNYGIA